MLLAVPVAGHAFEDSSGDWIPLFDGKSLNAWKASGHPECFKVIDGQLVASGGRAHIFYAGPVCNADFKNFELSLDAMTRPGADSYVCFHTVNQPAGAPANGLRVQITGGQTADWVGQGKHKTGSLYAVRNVYKQLVNDNEWFQLNILVRGKQVQIRVNNMLVVDYIEPDPPVQADLTSSGALDHGTFAFPAMPRPWAHTYFKNIRVRPLPDNVALLSARGARSGRPLPRDHSPGRGELSAWSIITST